MQIRAGLPRNRIALNWIYLRRYNSAGSRIAPSGRADHAGDRAASFLPDLAHALSAYQAETPEDIAKAVADVGRQQNLPLDFLEQIPRQDYSRHCLAAAAFSACMLLLYAPCSCGAGHEAQPRASRCSALAALAFGLLAAYQGWRLHRAERVNAAIASASSGLDAPCRRPGLRARRRLAEPDNYDEAVKTYKALIQGDRARPKRLRCYNLGNLHMREALKSGAERTQRRMRCR